MPSTEFKQEPVWHQMLRVWRENRGNWLLLTGLLVSVLAWAIGYFRLIPEVTVRRPSSPTYTLGVKALTVEITGCKSDQGRVIAMLYDAESFNETSVALRMEELEIVDQQAQWVIHNLPYARYAIYAFQDLDSNDTVDPTTEPQGLSTGDNDSPATSTSTEINYSNAAFEFSPQHPSVQVELR
ncbi:MAG: DUF2141 domain-containing protein [Pirellulaceae bacterium]|nr:DUF2141 domain-containing protein [Pirellulaceae bacterium]